MLDEVSSIGRGGRKLFVVSIVALALLVLPAAIFAQNQIQSKSPVQVQTQNRIEKREAVNVSQATESMVATQAREKEKEVDIDIPGEEKAKSSNLRSAIARDHMSSVAATVEQLLVAREEKGGIGQQIREIAQQQKQAQVEVRQQLEKMETRRGLLKKLIGPNFKAIRNVRQYLKRNQLRIERLEQLKSQLSTQIDKDNVDQAIQALKEQGQALQEQISAEERVKSVFGWLFRLFNR